MNVKMKSINKNGKTSFFRDPNGNLRGRTFQNPFLICNLKLSEKVLVKTRGWYGYSFKSRSATDDKMRRQTDKVRTIVPGKCTKNKKNKLFLNLYWIFWNSYPNGTLLPIPQKSYIYESYIFKWNKTRISGHDSDDLHNTLSYTSLLVINS